MFKIKKFTNRNDKKANQKGKMTIKKKLSTTGDSLYRILEIPKQAPIEEVRQSYKKLVVKYHPDKNHGNKETIDKFVDISKAHAILTNDTSRKLYDKFGSAGLNVADRLGKHNVTSYIFINTPLTQCFATFCFLTTFCCCCCCFCCCYCCNFCCTGSRSDEGKSKISFQVPDISEEDDTRAKSNKISFF